MIHLKTHLLILITICLTISCSLTRSTQQKTRATAKLPQYWLTTSMFAGPFYDDKRLTLIDYRPFSAIDDAKTIDDYTLYPPNSDHIIRAGTLMRLERVSYPDKNNKFKRPIFSPHENIWVHFKVAKERGDVTIFEKNSHIMVIPRFIKTKEQLKTYLSQFFTTLDPNETLLKERKFIQQAIWLKRPAIGMSANNLLSALGPPLKKQREDRGGLESARNLWHYHNYFIILEDGLVSKIKNLQAN